MKGATQRRYRGASLYPSFSALRLPASSLHLARYGAEDLSVVQAVASSIETRRKGALHNYKFLKRCRCSENIRGELATIENCRAGARCGCWPCKICGRIYRIWLSSQVVALAQMGVPATVVTILLRVIEEDELGSVDLKREADRLRKELLRVGITAAIGGFEVAYKPLDRYWCFHVHLLVFGDTAGPLADLKASHRKAKIKRALVAQDLNDPVEQITYLFKFVTYYRFGRWRLPYPLGRRQLEQLVVWTSGANFTDFLFLLGFQRRGSISAGPAFRRLLSDRRGDVATWRRQK